LLKSLFVIYIRQWQYLINFLNYIFVKCRLKCTRIVVQCLWRSLDTEIIKGIIWSYVKNCVNRDDWRFWHLSSRQRLTVFCISSQFNIELTCYFWKYLIQIEAVVTFLLLTFMNLTCVLSRDSYWHWKSPSIIKNSPLGRKILDSIRFFVI
jgi:hypothetical protein